MRNVIWWLILSILIVGCTGCMINPDSAADEPDATESVTGMQSSTPTESLSGDPAQDESVPTEAHPTGPGQNQPIPPVSEPTEPGPTEPGPILPERSDVVVPILMFHDVKSVPGGTWSMSADNFRARMEFLIEEGYTPVTFTQLVEFVDGIAPLPEKPVCITLDDGYYSNYRYVLPIVTELEIPVTVFMVCETVRAAGVSPNPDESMLSKLNTKELIQMEASPYVDVQSHTYGMHGVNSSYSRAERDSTRPLATESKTEYRRIFNQDCALAEQVLTIAGVRNHLVFSYPNGKYHSWTEQVLHERGYRVSLTTDYGHRNLITVGDPDSLFLLGRMNVNDDTTDAQLLKYLERE